MTIEPTGIKTSVFSMDSKRAESSITVPDEFWDELQDLIQEIDIAFDEELIQLKEQDGESIIENNEDKRPPKPVEPEINVSTTNSKQLHIEPVVPADDGLIIGTRRPKPIPLQSVTNGLPVGCEPLSQESADDLHLMEAQPKSSSSSPVSHKEKKKHKKESKSKKSKKDKKKSKKRRRSRSRSSSTDSLQKMYNQLQRKLKEKDLLEDIMKARSPSPTKYEPYKINLPDLNFKPLQPSAVLSYPGYGAKAYGYKRKSPIPSTSYSGMNRKSRSPDRRPKSPGYGAIQLHRFGSPTGSNRSPSPFEPFISGPMELIIPRSPVKGDKFKKSSSRSPSYKSSKRSPSRRGRSRSFSPRRQRNGSMSPKRRRSRSNSRRKSKSISPASSRSISRRRSRSNSRKRGFGHRRSRSISPAYRIRRSPSYAPYERKKSPISKKRRSRTPSPVRNRRARNRGRSAFRVTMRRSRDSTPSSISDRSKSSKLRSVSPRQQRKNSSREESKESTLKPIKPISDDDENWDDLVKAAPKAPPKAYDIDAIKKKTETHAKIPIKLKLHGTSKLKPIVDQEDDWDNESQVVPEPKKVQKNPSIVTIVDSEDDWDANEKPAKPSGFKNSKNPPQKPKKTITANDEEDDWDELVDNINIQPPSSYNIKTQKIKVNFIGKIQSKPPVRNYRKSKPVDEEEQKKTMQREQRAKSEDGELSNSPSPSPLPVRGASPISDEDEKDKLFDNDQMDISEIISDEEDLKFCEQDTEMDKLVVNDVTPEKSIINRLKSPEPLPPGIEPSDFESPEKVFEIVKKVPAVPTMPDLLPPGIEPEEFEEESNNAKVTIPISHSALSPELLLPPGIKPGEFVPIASAETPETTSTNEKEEAVNSPIKPTISEPVVPEQKSDEDELISGDTESNSGKIDDVEIAQTNDIELEKEVPSLVVKMDENLADEPEENPVSLFEEITDLIEDESQHNAADNLKRESTEMNTENPEIAAKEEEMKINLKPESIELHNENVETIAEEEIKISSPEPVIQNENDEIETENRSHEELETVQEKIHENDETLISEPKKSITLQKATEESAVSASNNNIGSPAAPDNFLKNLESEPNEPEQTTENITEEAAEEIPDIDHSNLIPESEIKEKQDEDMIYSRIKECLVQNYPPTDDIRFLMDEYQTMALTEAQLLYRETEDGIKLTVIPEPLIEKIIDSVHIVSQDRHLSERITLERVEQFYFWPFMSDTVHDYIINCKICNGK